MEEYNKDAAPKTPGQKKEHDKEYDKKQDEEVLHDEQSKSVRLTQPDIPPRDTVRDAKDRFDGESPAQKDQPNRAIPEPVDEDGTVRENPDEDDELEELDPDAEKNIK